jgi:hypothetical protein
MSGEDAVEFTLLENGLDFIWSAIEHLDAAGAKAHLKYAVLHLSAGIELVLKERLRQKDWRLLFQDGDKASEDVYRSGAFRSVVFETCLERLEAECLVDLSEAEDRLRAVREKRNRLEHLALVDSREAVIAVAAEALGAVVDFVREELSGQPFSSTEEDLLAKIRAKLPELDAFVTTQWKSIESALKQAYRVLPYPACLQKSLAIKVSRYR